MLEHYLNKKHDESLAASKLEKLGYLIETMAARQVEAQIIAMEIAEVISSPPHPVPATGATAVAELDSDGCLKIKTNIYTPKVSVYPRGKHKLQGVMISNYPEVRNLWHGAIKRAMANMPLITHKKAAILIKHLSIYKIFDPPNFENKVIIDALVSARILQDDSFKNLALITMGEHSCESGTEIYVVDYNNKDLLFKKLPAELPFTP